MFKKYATYLALVAYIVTLAIVSIVFKDNRIKTDLKNNDTLIKSKVIEQTKKQTKSR